MKLIAGCVTRKYDNGIEICHVLMKMERTTLAVPVNPIEKSDKAKDIWKEMVAHSTR